MNTPEIDYRNKIKDDEIDLSLVALNLINIIKRYRVLLIMIVSLGCLIGVFQYYKSAPYYETSLIATSRVLTFNQVANLIKVLDKLAAEGNHSLLAKKMNVSISVAENISQLKAVVVEEEVTRVTDDDDETLAFKRNLALANNVSEIVLTTTDNKQLDSIQTGLLFYLETNPFVEKRKSIQKRNLERMQTRLLEEVKKLDSLRLSVNKLISQSSANTSTTIVMDPSSINRSILELYKREQNLQTELALIDDVQIIQGFTPFEQPSGPGLLKVIAIALGASLALGFILIALLEIRRGIRKVRIQQNQLVIKENQLV